MRVIGQAIALLVALASTFLPLGCAAGRPLEFVAADGARLAPLSTGAPATVLLFTRADCPISNRYAPEVRRLIGKFAPLGVAFFLVYPDAATSAAQVRAHVAGYGYPCPALLDPGHRLVALVGAEITPEAALFDREGRLLYHGRIDDRFASFGVARPQPARRDLEEALVALLDGREPPSRHEPAIGCLIADLPRDDRPVAAPPEER